jgi:hypothetical protein
MAIDGSLERLGVASVLVVAAYFMIRYFISVVAAKDRAISDLTERFIVVTERFATATEANTRTMDAIQESMDRLTGEFRAALGDAIVEGAQQAIRSATEAAAQVNRAARRQ